MLCRVDKRKFEVGDTITPKTTFENAFEKEKKEVEEMLNQNCNPKIPERKECLFLFRDLICALQFYNVWVFQ